MMGGTPDFASAPDNYNSGVTLTKSGVITTKKAVLHAIRGYNDAVAARFILIYDLATVPADGTGGVPVDVIAVAADSEFVHSYGSKGKSFNQGVAWACSTTAPAKTLTTGDDVYVAAEYEGV